MDLLMSGLRSIRGGRMICRDHIHSTRHVMEAGAQDRAADPNAAAAAAAVPPRRSENRTSRRDRRNSLCAVYHLWSRGRPLLIGCGWSPAVR